jgi:hypothetical protein
MVAVLGFTEDYEAYSQSILTAMSELCYLMSFAKSLPDSKYIVNFSVPADQVSAMSNLLLRLKERGMFSHVDLIEFDWIRNPPMKAEYYDFDEGRWDFDFTGPHAENLEAASFRPSVSTQFDSIDLLIIKQLQKDANKSLKEIADELKLNYKKLAWHHNTHVVGRSLIRGYRVNWMGTGYNFKIDRAFHRKHKYIPGIMILRNVDPLTLAFVRQKIDQLPFLWAEAAGKNYYAEFAFPVDYLTESLLYVSEAVAKVKDRVRIFAVDQTNALGFTIAPQLFNEKTRSWSFNREELEARFESLIQQIKREAG